MNMLVVVLGGRRMLNAAYIRFILADTDRLHRKIAEMSDRIRTLEDALALLQSSVTRDPHPLLRTDLLGIKSGLELHAATRGAGGSGGGGTEGVEGEDIEEEEEETQYVDAFGTLAVRDDGAATFYGRSAGSESLLLDDKPHLTLSTLSRSSSSHPDLPQALNRLAATFPSGPTDLPILDLQDLMQDYLPPWQRAAQLRDLYLEQAPWFFGAVTRRQIDEEVLPLFYEEAEIEMRHRVEQGFSGTGALGSSAEAFNLPGRSTQPSSHDLALLFVIFCFGTLTDPSLPPAPHNAEAARYYQLTRAALSLEPVLDRPPSVTTVQTLSLMGIYQGLVADEHSIETTWALMGLSSKLAQSVGLHRDSARWKLSSAEVQKRRALFWELFITDCWQALATGRLPTFALQFVDAELPADPDETLSDDGIPQPSFPSWKARWGKECVASVVMGTLTAQAPKYSVILDLDRRIRDMPLPKYAQGEAPKNAGLAQTMSHFMPTNYLHLTLLYVHRCFFAQAILDNPGDPMRSQYAPSFLAGYRSACSLLSSIREQFTLFPVQIARFWVLWTHAFSACVMMGSVVTRGGTSKTAQAALSELRVACDLFERAATHGGRAGKFLPVVRKLHEKAQAAYFKGFQPLRRDIFTPRSEENDNFDELSIFSGRTARTVTTKSNRPQRVSPNTSAAGTPSDASAQGSQGGSSGSDGRNSQSPAAEVFPALESSYRAAIHPGLVDELKSFEGQLEQQINQTNAYYTSAPLTQPDRPGPSMTVYGGQPQPQHFQESQLPQYNQYPQHTSAQHLNQQPQFQQPQHLTHSQAVQQQDYDYSYHAQHQPDAAAHPIPHTQHEYQNHYIPPQQAYHSGVHPAEPLSRRVSYHQSAAPINAVPPPPAHIQPANYPQDPHSLPMYGGFSKAPQQQQQQYDAYDQPSMSSHQPEHSAYAIQPTPGQALPDDWRGNVPPAELSPEQHPYPTPTAPAYHPQFDEHTPAHTQTHTHTHYDQHAPAFSAAHVHPPQTPGQAAQGQQYAYAQQVQQMVPPPPAPPPPLIHVHTGGYSLQETWTSFIQQELPPPPQGRVPPQSGPPK
ncbi:fungal-specific transcription factor domain-containing protein [Trametes elegans]|nr:fungal-specific transcription factor domain-containing protein [Trametes elegans]